MKLILVLKIKVFVILFLLSAMSIVNAQEIRLVEGSMKEDGDGMPGVNIMIKGTNKGTITDLDGNYSIEAPLGSTIQFSFIGYKTTEMIVTMENSKLSLSNSTTKYQEKQKKEVQPEIIVAPPPPPASVAYEQQLLPKRAKSNNSNQQILSIEGFNSSYFYHNLSKIKSIKYIVPLKINISQSNEQKVGKLVFDIIKPKFIKVPQLEYSTSFSIRKAVRLPKLQNSFAQGRPKDGDLQWHGAETNEMFSWGPEIASLSFDGSKYDYDNNGGLIAMSDGLENANAYKSTNFIQSGYTYSNSLRILNNSYSSKLNYDLMFNRVKNTGIIPTTGRLTNEAILNFTIKANSRFKINSSTTIKSMKNDKAVHGSSMYGILASLYLTPPSFDNFNGMNSKDAVKNSNSYLLDDGSQRSYSPDEVNNPYWLLNQNRIEDKIKLLRTNIDFEYSLFKNFIAAYKFGFEAQNNNQEYDFDKFTALTPLGQIGRREEKYNNYNSDIYLSDGIYYGDWKFDITVGYNYYKTDINIDKTTSLNLNEAQDFNIENAKSAIYDNRETYRNVHGIYGAAKFGYSNYFNVNISGRNDFSKTKNNKSQTLQSFYSGIATTISDFRFMRHVDFITLFKIYGSYRWNENEIPLNTSSSYFNSTNYNITDKYVPFISQELLEIQDANPEKISSLNVGTNLYFFRNRLRLTFNYYNKETANLLVPQVLDIQQIKYINGGTLKNSGFDFSVNSVIVNCRSLNWNVDVTFSKNKSIVTKLLGKQERISIAGFQSVSTNLIEGEPYGVIYGSKYLRNDNNKIIVDQSGFPIVDAKLGIIGNPNPDWVASIENRFSTRWLSLSFQWEFSKGGDVWNGTQNVLNYYGVSKTTEDQRNTTNYIFDGVKQNGEINDISVDFANPQNDLDDNRWVRYGVGGVAEEAIEDASWIRLSDITLTINSPRRRNMSVSLSFWARNLLLFTNYKGSDPAISIYGDSNAIGLDFFNMPAIKSYGITFKINI